MHAPSYVYYAMLPAVYMHGTAILIDFLWFSSSLPVYSENYQATIIFPVHDVYCNYVIKEVRMKYFGFFEFPVVAIEFHYMLAWILYQDIPLV